MLRFAADTTSGDKDGIMSRTGLSVFGQLGEFNPDSEKISTYLERLKVFMEANSVGEDKKVAVLLTVIGTKDYALLQGLLAPTNLREKSFDELTQALKTHYEPKLVSRK